MTLEVLEEILDDVNCGIGGIDWEVGCGLMGDGLYIQLRYVEVDVQTGDPGDQHGRKWYVSSHSTKSEVVQTVLKACLTSAEHMVREHFLYRGTQVFGPHLDVDQLFELAHTGKASRDVRAARKG